FLDLPAESADRFAELVDLVFARARVAVACREFPSHGLGTVTQFAGEVVESGLVQVRGGLVEMLDSVAHIAAVMVRRAALAVHGALAAGALIVRRDALGGSRAVPAGTL
ncbi:MAG TPA: hypothetical protein VML55_06770, partial [Planctomycetaceae bacterium]|nr:hypothetical protein [Planctomycetaceae bacterium]